MQLGCVFANVCLPGVHNVNMYSTPNGLQLSGFDVIHLLSQDSSVSTVTGPSMKLENIRLSSSPSPVMVVTREFYTILTGDCFRWVKTAGA
jgi:hypothetical protein